MHKTLKSLSLMLILLLVAGCGFQLRGVVTLPESLKTVQILPNQPFDPFQRNVAQTLKANGVTLVDLNTKIKNTATLTLLTQEFSERVTAYGADGQANQILLKLKVSYQLTDPQGTVILDNKTVEVEREFLITPSAVLSNNNERERLKDDLTTEAAVQLVRQLSVTP